MQASSANGHHQIASQYPPSDHLPCADAALLVPLKKSPEYRTIRPRIANPEAADSWQEDGLHFFVFALTAADGTADNSSDPPVVVFTLHHEEAAPISVVVVTPKDNGAAEVMDLRQPNNTYIAPLLVTTMPAQHLDTLEQHEQALVLNITSEKRITIEHMPASSPASAHMKSAGIGELNNHCDGSQVDSVAGMAAAISLPQTARNDTVEAMNGRAPNVNVELLGAVKELSEYQAIQDRLADREPTDVWQEGDLQFFVFPLYQGDEATINTTESPVAVFAMNPEFSASVAAVIVTPGRNGEADEITNLHEHERGSRISDRRWFDGQVHHVSP